MWHSLSIEFLTIHLVGPTMDGLDARTNLGEDLAMDVCFVFFSLVKTKNKKKWAGQSRIDMGRGPKRFQCPIKLSSIGTHWPPFEPVLGG